MGAAVTPLTICQVMPTLQPVDHSFVARRKIKGENPVFTSLLFEKKPGSFGFLIQNSEEVTEGV